MKEYTYSFIIPHHNCPDLLNRLIGTIPMRDDIEIIVVDDKSDENKKPRITARPDVKILYISKEDSKGAGKARNVGMAEATGKWLMFADADDFYKEGFIDILDEYKDKDIDVLYYGFDYLYSDTLEPVEGGFDIQDIILEYDGSKYMEEEVRYKNNVPWSKMVNRLFAVSNKIYFEEVINGNDLFFSLFVGNRSNKIAVDKRSIYVYIQNRGSLTNKIPSVNALMCRLEHRIKHNEFNTYIGHKEWNSPFFFNIIRVVKFRSVVLIFRYYIEIMKKMNTLYKTRLEFIEIICNQIQ